MGRPCAADASLGYGETDLSGSTCINWEDMRKYLVNMRLRNCIYMMGMVTSRWQSSKYWDTKSSWFLIIVGKSRCFWFLLLMRWDGKLLQIGVEISISTSANCISVSGSLSFDWERAVDLHPLPDIDCLPTDLVAKTHVGFSRGSRDRGAQSQKTRHLCCLRIKI